jgi:hypothetical protein
MRQGAQKPALSARASSEPPNLDEIAEDNHFTVITSRKKQRKMKIKPTITDTANNKVLPSSSTPENKVSVNPEHKDNQFITAPRQKIRPVVIHRHFQSDMTRLNKIPAYRLHNV